jgi:tRNA(Ile)-lysidine synthase
MRPVADLCGVRILRPLLCLRRNEIERFLAEQGVRDWRQDATNADTSLRRNAVRHLWLPLLRRTVGHDEGLRRSLEALGEDADCLAELARECLGTVHDSQALRRLHPALLPRVLRLWLRQETGQDWVMPRQAVLRLRRELARLDGARRRVPIGQGCHLELGPAGLRLVSRGPAVAERSWSWRDCPRLELAEVGAVLTAETVADGAAALPSRGGNAEIFDADALGPTLTVRSWQPGDRMVPFGRKRPAKLQDLFTNECLPRDRRRCVPLVLSGGTIIWVPGVRRAEFGRVRPDQAAVRLRLCPGPATGGSCRTSARAGFQVSGFSVQECHPA